MLRGSSHEAEALYNQVLDTAVDDRGRRTFPSYTQAGPSFFIEKSKRSRPAKAISQDSRPPGCAIPSSGPTVDFGPGARG
jgi:hypothetical protein